MQNGTKRAACAVGLAALCAGVASAVYQAAGERRDRKRFPAPGRLVDLGPDFSPMMELVTGTFARRG